MVSQLEREVVNLLSGGYLFRWNEAGNLLSISSKGLLSRLAQGNGLCPNVFLTPEIDDIWGNPFYRRVGIAVKRRWEPKLPQWTDVIHGPEKIDPKEFVAWIVVDRPPQGRPNSHHWLYEQTARNRVNRLLNLMRMTEGGLKTLPIYGTSGDLYWPQRIIHARIIEMLEEKPTV